MGLRKPGKLESDEEAGGPGAAKGGATKSRHRSATRTDDKLVRVHRWEQEATRLRQVNELLLAHTADWVFRLDESGKLRAASPSTAGLLGYQPEELLGRFLVDLMSPATREGFKPWLTAALDHVGPQPFY